MKSDSKVVYDTNECYDLILNTEYIILSSKILGYIVD